MRILYRRENQFIVEKDKKFYLVNLQTKKATLAEPPDKPDMFLRLGYFQDANLNAAEFVKINSIMFKMERGE